MIHYTCDACHEVIDSERETRYVVRLEVYAAVEERDEQHDEIDHLEEIEDLLERMDDPTAVADEDLYKQARYDLCPACRERFLANPLGRVAVGAKLGFSSN